MHETTSPRPVAPPVCAKLIPATLRALNQWVCWRYEYKHGAKQPWTKVPYMPHSSMRASSTNPRTWGLFEAALQSYQGQGRDGIGLVLAAKNHLAGIDLDHCCDPETGAIVPWAQAIVDRLQTYTEVSPSGEGLRLLVRGQLPPGRRKKDAIEMYETARFLTITGVHVDGTPATVEARQPELDALHTEVFTTPKKLWSNTQEPSHDTNGYHPLADDVLLEKALGAKNGQKFARLWRGDIDGYPSQSEADLALCDLLAFWTQDEAQLDRLFRRSSLYREKWDEVHGPATYGQMTIQTALSRAGEHWTPPRVRSDRDQHVSNGKGPEMPGDNGHNLPEDERHTAENGEVGDAPGTDQREAPRPKMFFRKKTFIPKRLGDYLLTQYHIKYAAEILWVYRNGVYVPNGERILAAAAQHLLGEERRQNRIEETLRYIEVATYAELPAPDLRYINLLNGRLEWATGVLHAHTPDVFTVIQLPVCYDPHATCPTFDHYLETTLDNDVIPLVEEVMGDLLIPDTRYEKATMITGEGENGKSVFIDTLTALLGPQHVSNVALQDLEENRFRVAELFGKLGNFFADLDPRALKASSLFKTLVTGDEIEAERKFKDPFKFRNVARLLFSANKLPDSSDRTHAFYRRWHVIPFTRTFTGSNRDPDLRAKLARELPGILLRALNGLKHLSEHRGFTIPQAVRDALSHYERQNDSLAAFLEEAVDIGPTFSVSKQRFYQRYCRWCDVYRLRRVGQRELRDRLYQLVPELDEARFDARGHRGGKGPWRWIGISPIDAGFDEEET